MEFKRAKLFQFARLEMFRYRRVALELFEKIRVLTAGVFAWLWPH